MAEEAKNKLNGTEFDGRKIIVNEARPKGETRSGDHHQGPDLKVEEISTAFNKL